MELNFKKIIKKECCLMLKSKTKEDVLNELIQLLKINNYILDDKSLQKEIFHREELMSTGIGMGIAIPHVRFPQIKEPIIAFGIQPQGISNYEAIDNVSVKIVAMILVGEHQHKEHIKLLALLVNILKDNKKRENLINSKTQEEIYNILTGEKNA
jgi:mannitol/fructose-specific phosphotransferase system IIA component (Ntr-type)